MMFRRATLIVVGCAAAALMLQPASAQRGAAPSGGDGADGRRPALSEHPVVDCRARATATCWPLTPGRGCRWRPGGKVDLMQAAARRARLARLAERAARLGAVAADRRARHGDRAGRDFSHNIDNEQIPGWARGWDGRTGTLKGTLHNVPWAERVADDEQVAERAREILKRLPQVV